MITDLNLKLNNLGPIGKVDIKIGKINIIGGQNATGKSTLSKLLYCLLKGNTLNRQDFAFSLIKPSMRSILRRYKIAPIHEIMSLSDEELEQYYEKFKWGLLDNTRGSKWSIGSSKTTLEKIDKQLEVIEKNDDDLYLSILKRELTSEFQSLDFEGTLSLNGICDNDIFEYSFDLDNNSIVNSSMNGFFYLSDVNYIDSISILDFRPSRRVTRDKNERLTHILDNINDDSEALEFLEDEINEKIIRVEKIIKNLIKGKFVFKDGEPAFISDDGHETFMGDTSSGIKQIGVILILLANRKLKENSFLIIDEPEVNLHPEWQFKLAEILVILARDLNIFIYVNTHSPMFIESMEVFTKYHDLENDTNFYLAQKLENENTVELIEIGYNNLYKLYNNLAKPFESIDVYRLKTEYKKGK